MEGILDGKKITQIAPHYEQISVWIDGVRYFIKYSDLTAMMSEFIFEAKKKRTRTWLHPVTPDVKLLYDQNKYPTGT